MDEALRAGLLDDDADPAPTGSVDVTDLVADAHRRVGKPLPTPEQLDAERRETEGVRLAKIAAEDEARRQWETEAQAAWVRAHSPHAGRR